MKPNKLIFLFFLSLFITSKVFSQSDNLRIIIHHQIHEETPCFVLTIYNKSDTVYARTITDEYEVSIDSLASGKYSINLKNCGSESDDLIQSITQNVEIKPFQIVELVFDFYRYINYIEVDTISSNEIIKSRAESQFTLSYFDYRWKPDGIDPKFNLGVGWAGYHWSSFSKHFGFLVGGGASYMFAPLRIEPNSASIYQEEVKSNYYSYLSGQFDMKFRFSSLNQQSKYIKGHSVFFDIGVLYNLPLYFKKVTRFNIRDKMINSFIHQYTDARAYVNIGFTNVQFFVSYRPFDFIRGDYQELPRYNAGIKININY